MTRARDTNQAESFFSRLRRAEIGQHHRIGVHLHQYAGEMAWREDNRRKPTGAQFMSWPAPRPGIRSAGTPPFSAEPASSAASP